MIYDEIHGTCLMHGAHAPWFVVDSNILPLEQLPGLSQKEAQVQNLFRYFCHKISIKERENKMLQRQMLPNRFRSDMVEFS